MAHNQKDKRTKDQILRLLDRALEQEEKLGEKISQLEKELAACRKKVENPLQEFTEEALSSSKISFRIDYYRTAQKGPLKGVIEHLPSRTNKTFSGDGMPVFEKFMSKYLPELAKLQAKTPIDAPPAIHEAEAGIPDQSIAAPEKCMPRQSLLQRLMNEFKQMEEEHSVE